MSIALDIVAGFIAVAAATSSIGKFQKKDAIVTTLSHVGVKREQLNLLGALEALGALGVLVGIWSKPLAIAATTGLALYFLGAVVAHLRIKDKVKDFAPALFLMLVAIAAALLEAHR